MKAVLILSGGVDSSTLGYWLKKNGYSELICVTFNYGQKQIIELKSASTIAKQLDAVHYVLDIQFVKDLFSHSSSSLINPNIDVPQGAYTKDNMQSTVVPNRNATLLTIAWSIACTQKANILAYGAHSGDHYLYPDTRPEFFHALNLSLRLGTEDCRSEDLSLIAPFINWNKAAVIKEGAKLGVPFELTWSCYVGGEIQCGLCGACSERKKAFLHANIFDPTIYKD